MVDPNEMMDPSLTGEERMVLYRGLGEWGGPAHCTTTLANAMGCSSVDHLIREGERIADEIEAHRPLSRRDWTRALLGTEIVFASDVVGSGYEWPTTTGLDDVHTLQVLRGLQVKLVAVVVRRGAWESNS